MSVISNQAETFLHALSEELEIPSHFYEQAENSYKSFARWLHRDASAVHAYSPDVYVQGSFRLGTAIRPPSEEDEYDVDSVCVLRKLSKEDLSQASLKALLEKETKNYRKARSIIKPVKEGRRCWTLEYADGAQFHMDILPALINAQDQRILLENSNFDAQWAETAIAITDNEVDNFNQITSDWPRSNPKGYAAWFISQMGDVFTRQREVLLEEKRKNNIKASIEDIPDYKVRTPLQSAIMILKRHRDEMFIDDTENKKPISIILTTLCAHAYGGEETIGESLFSILNQMDEYIRHDGECYKIANPTDNTENFADKWEDYPERSKAFFDWLKQVREDFYSSAKLSDHKVIAESLGARFGDSVIKRTISRLAGIGVFTGSSLLKPASAAPKTEDSDFSFSDKPRSPSKPQDFA